MAQHSYQHCRRGRLAVREMVLMNASAALYVAGKVPFGFGLALVSDSLVARHFERGPIHVAIGEPPRFASKRDSEAMR